MVVMVVMVGEGDNGSRGSGCGGGSGGGRGGGGRLQTCLLLRFGRKVYALKALFTLELPDFTLLVTESPTLDKLRSICVISHIGYLRSQWPSDAYERRVLVGCLLCKAQ